MDYFKRCSCVACGLRRLTHESSESRTEQATTRTSHQPDLELSSSLPALFEQEEKDNTDLPLGLYSINPYYVAMDLDVNAAATLLGVAYKKRKPHGDGASGSLPLRGEHLATTTAPVSASRTPPRANPNESSVYQHQQQVHAIPVAAPIITSAAPVAPSSNTLLSMSSIGFGIDSSATSSWGDATDAAMKAIQDAMDRSTLRLPMNANNCHTSSSLQISVHLGVPAKQVGECEPMMVNVSRLTAMLPQGIRLLPIRVVVGGLYLPGSPPVCTAVACITLQTAAAAIAVAASPKVEQLPTPPAAPVVINSGQSRAPHKIIHDAVPASRSPWASLDAQQTPSEMHQAPQLPSPVVPALPPLKPTQAGRQVIKSDTTHANSAAPPTADPGTRSSPNALANGHLPTVPQARQGQPCPILVAAAAAAATKPKLHQSASIEMLAIISEEMRLNGDRRLLNGDHRRSVSAPLLAPLANHFPPIASKTQFQETTLAVTGPATAALQQPTLEYHSSYEPGGAYGDGIYENPGSPLSEEELRLRNAYNYKKLPAGVTTKNNLRLFVKHTYRDYSGDHPLPEEQDLIIEGSAATSASRTPNAAFPLKLHETLTQIEANGHGDIIGWMPHGRSFKIHKQLEFAEIILPRYFVMTKKSSFLRQLNLYGFNRFSAGQDQGSYYHEKFLRGLKFLCRRMTRQKVNGNRIRSAGNPDDEPVLAHFPSCPRGYTDPAVTSGENSPQSSNLPPSKRFTYIAQEEEDDEDVNDSERRQADDSQDQEGEDDNEGDGDDDGTATTCSNSATKATPTPQPLQQPSRNNSGSQVSFPLKLQRMLDKVEADGMLDAISWLSHGRAFIVRNPDIFVENLMPVFFNQTKYNSFVRQLNLYNFQRITTGRDKGAWHHAYFQRGKPHLCVRMVRTKVNGTGCRKLGNPSSEPNLYSMQPLPAIPPGTVIEVPTGSSEGDEASDGDA